jgi:hypothetical protein
MENYRNLNKNSNFREKVPDRADEGSRADE